MSEKDEVSRTERIPLLVTKDEKDEIKKMAKNANMKISEFIRNAITDKIRRIKNPELPNLNSQTFNPETITQLIANQKRTIELQEAMMEREKIFDEMNKTLKLIQKYSNVKGLQKEK